MRGRRDNQTSSGDGELFCGFWRLSTSSPWYFLDICEILKGEYTTVASASASMVEKTTLYVFARPAEIPCCYAVGLVSLLASFAGVALP